MQIINCCYKCENREIGCHSICEIYLKQRSELDKENEKLHSYKVKRGMTMTVSKKKNFDKKHK